MLQNRQIRASSRSAQSGFAGRRKALRLAALLPWVVLVAACGQKGPLYHPPEPPEPPEPDEEEDNDQTSAAPTAPDSRLG